MVSFLFAGRGLNGLIPQVNQNSAQRLVVVCTEKEYEKNVSKTTLTNSMDFLVIESLESETHGIYNNTGSIQARRLAGFLFAAYRELEEVLFLDDNIESIEFTSKNKNGNALSWQEVTSCLIKAKGDNKSLISTIRTLCPMPDFMRTRQDYAYKVVCINFKKATQLFYAEYIEFCKQNRVDQGFMSDGRFFSKMPSAITLGKRKWAEAQSPQKTKRRKLNPIKAQKSQLQRNRMFLTSADKRSHVNNINPRDHLRALGRSKPA